MRGLPSIILEARALRALLAAASQKWAIVGSVALATLLCTFSAGAQSGNPSASSATDDSEVRPPVTEADLRIVKRARELLDSPSKWNRVDNRKCPRRASTLSLYCALETAAMEAGGKFEHRGAALQEVRFVIDEVTPNRDYDHRLMDYNNDPTTTLADIQQVLGIAETIFALRLKSDGPRKITMGADGADRVEAR